MNDNYPSKTATELTQFQRTILTVIAITPQYGLEIKSNLEKYYREEVNHGRLYPNLDQLVDKKLLDKEPLDKRTNQYSITENGLQTLQELHEWETKVINRDHLSH